jgi:hypothetical protein
MRQGSHEKANILRRLTRRNGQNEVRVMGPQPTVWALEPTKLFGFFIITGAGFMQEKENGIAALRLKVSFSLKVPFSWKARRMTHPVVGVLQLIGISFPPSRLWVG